jgi:MSHA biogenesis protein MshL
MTFMFRPYSTGKALRLTAALLVMGFVLSGCTSTYTQGTTQSLAARARTTVLEDRAPTPTNLEDDGIHIRAIPIDYTPPPRGSVTLALSEQPVLQVISSLAGHAGYSTAFAPGVDPRTPISVSFKGLEPIAAIREAAFAGGLVAIVDRNARSVTLAREAVFTYRLPAKTIRAFNLRYSMSIGGQGGTSTAAGGSTQASAQSGSSSAGVAATASSGTTQFAQSGGEFSPARLLEFLRVSTGTELTMLSDHGFMTARGNAQQLRRLSQFLDAYVRDTLTQVEVELSMVDVAVSSEIETGIDWKRVIGPHGLFGSATGSVSLAGGSTAGLEGGRVAVTTGSIDSIIKALERVTHVQEIVRPRFFTENHKPAIYQSLERRPFVPSAQTTVTPGVGNVIQTSASVEYFQDGMEFSMQPDVIDAHRVSLTLKPTLQNVRDVVEFKVSRDITLSAPRQPLEQALLNVIGQHNKTLVIAGLRSQRRADNATGVPGVTRVPGLNWLTGGTHDRSTSRDLIMLVHTRIIPAPDVDLVVSEAL